MAFPLVITRPCALTWRQPSTLLLQWDRRAYRTGQQHHRQAICRHSNNASTSDIICQLTEHGNLRWPFMAQGPGQTSHCYHAGRRMYRCTCICRQPASWRTTPAARYARQSVIVDNCAFRPHCRTRSLSRCGKQTGLGQITAMR